MCQIFSVIELNDFKQCLESSGSMEEKRNVFMNHFEKIKNISNGHHGSNGNLSQQSSTAPQQPKGETTNGNPKNWTYEDCQLLIKAVNLFPAGTKDRWEVVATYLEQHSVGKTKRKSRDVLAKAKELQKLDPSTLKQEANNNAFKELKVIATPNVESAPSERFDTPAVEASAYVASPVAWSNEEQKLLEQALKTYPASTDKRWDRIAECVPTRSKKEIMQRVKELVDIAKAKKAALTATARK